MDKQIDLGKEAGLDVKLEAGKVVISVKYDGADADASLSVSIDVDHLLDKLASKIPGQIDDAVLSVLKAALKAV